VVDPVAAEPPSSVPGRATSRLRQRLVEVALGPAYPGAKVIPLLALALPQLYLLPAGLVDVSSTTLWILLLAPGALIYATRGPGRALLRLGLVRILLALLALRLVATTWSPEPRAALQPIVLLGQFVISIVLLSQLLRSGVEPLRRIQRWYWPWIVAEACLVVLFRFLPALEEAFLRSVGGFFAGQNTVTALFGDSPNNVLDVAKSGGVFVNANVAAMFLGVNGLAALAVSSLTGTRWVRIVGIVALLAVPFTGSKSATVLAAVLPLVAFAVALLSRGTTPRLLRHIGFAAGASIAVGVLVLATRRDFLDAMIAAFVGRTAIWQFGAEAFRERPILGLGYGGWDAGFGQYAVERGIYDPTFPPHNLLLAAWAATGIAGVALTIAYLAFLYRMLSKGVRCRGDRGFVVYAGAALAWVAIQGMGENTDIFGDIHQIPIVALLIACLFWLGTGHPDDGDSRGHVTPADRRDHPAPAVPTVGDVHRQPGDGAAELSTAVRGEGSGPEHAG
jgi:Lipid A core - O-antigen ligase and related enzymes